ncbi:MAG: toxin TcdB middle/N-terminal domain-containing protein, partial [Candidatus Omnitrophota bacterium]|nr:toxin TcdB middle/N-terminal domain-containing protein [Candidatus Omnitrophota bacterium]
SVSITPSAYSVTTGSNFTLSITANDANNDPLTFDLKQGTRDIAVPPANLPYPFMFDTPSESFPAAGVYKYTITVTDGKAVTTDICTVEVVDTMPGDSDVFPISGDFNGDGLTDIGTFTKTTGDWKVSLSDKGDFNDVKIWLSGLKAPDARYGYSLTGDFDGNGKTDIALYDVDNATWKFAFSNGTSFVRNESWDITGFGGGECSPLIGDFNGDGITDIGYYTPSDINTHFSIRLAEEDRTGFMPTSITGETGVPNSQVYTGDFNGDGLVDITAFNRNSGEWKVLIAQDTTSTQTIDRIQEGTTTKVTTAYVGGMGGPTGGSDLDVFDGDWNSARTASGGAQQAGNGFFPTVESIFTFSQPVNLNRIIFKGESTASSNSGYAWAYGQVAISSIDNPTESDWTAGELSNDHSGDTKVLNGNWTVKKIRMKMWAGAASLNDATTFAGNYEIQACSFQDAGAAAGSFPSFASAVTWLPAFGAGKEPLVTDYDHDGKTDIGYFNTSDGKWYYALSNGSTEFTVVTGAQWPSDFGAGSYSMPSGGDYNGDGIGDASIFHKDRQGVLGKWEIKLHNSKQPDLLVSIDNGIGGTTQIEYEASTQFDNAGTDGTPDLPFPIQTVKKEIKSDGMGSSYEVDYEYKYGVFDSASREFRGFKFVKVIDSEGTVKETEFYQTDILKGKPAKEEVKDINDTVYSTVQYGWDDTNKAHGGLSDFPYMESQTSTIYNDKTGASRNMKTMYGQPDDYGNTPRIDELGFDPDDPANPGDERATLVEYENNVASYIIGKPKHTTIMKGEAKAAETWYRYDAFGSLKEEEKWLDTGAGNPVTKFKYDYDVPGQPACGNLVEVEDALGRKTTTTYDPAYEYAFPVQVANVLGYTQSFTYDKKTGQILTSTDPNGKITRTVYDNFGRTLKVIGPNDSDTSPGIEYVYNLNLRPVRIKTITKVDIGQFTTSYAFMDGLGRTIEVKTEAEEDGKQLLSGVVKYDSRGQVKEKYLQYPVPASENYVAPNYAQLKVRYIYDSVGRVIRTIRPDAVSSYGEYEGWMVTAIDENGHKIKQEKDAFGRLIKVTEYNGAAEYITQYQYDTLGNLTKTIDAESNATTITYDSLGRKSSMDDPDMGHWVYEYDALGNLKKQTDAKEQVINFVYDSINRLIEKSGLSPQGTVPDFSVTYTYDTITPDNLYAKGRLVKVTDSSGTTEFFYDNLGREIKTVKVINSSGGLNLRYEVQRTYDSIDRLKTVTYPDGEVLTYTYNNAGGIKTVSSPSKTYITNITYNERGQMVRIDYGNGTHTE